MVLVDTNVLIDVFTDDRIWRRWSEAAIRDALVSDSAAINPIIYAEASIGFSERSVLDRHLDALTLLRLPLPYEAAFPRAGLSSARRARGAAPRRSRLLRRRPRQTQNLRLLTRDPNRYALLSGRAS